jgi:ribosomal protein S18 acetylase RimI-like enzyme
MGLGTSLLSLAQERSATLQLRVFQRNTGAIRFYLARGFRLAEQTNGDRNEERSRMSLYLGARPSNGPISTRA